MKITFKNDICVAMDFVKICSTYKSPIELLLAVMTQMLLFIQIRRAKESSLKQV